MEALKQKIRTEGKAIGKDIVKVDGFLNHQLDIRFLDEIGAEFRRRFEGVPVDRILTVESSGIAIATATAPHFGYPPVVFAKKAAPNTMTEGFYEQEARSFTKGTVSRLCISERFLKPGENVLILDDFLAYGEASLALVELVRRAGAQVAGIGIVIEKGFQGGSAKLKAKNCRVESLAVIEKIEDGVITFAETETSAGAEGAGSTAAGAGSTSAGGSGNAESAGSTVASANSDSARPLTGHGADKPNPAHTAERHSQERKVDYHIHTTCSDGASTPTQIVRQAKELGYDEIAITDHDNTSGLAEALKVAEEEQMRVLTGIEIATQTEEGVGLHILGYRFDPENEELQGFLDAMIERRKNRNAKLFAELQAMGYDIREEELKTGENSFVGKPVIARAMLEKGYIKEYKEAFGPDILGSPRCRAIKKAKPSSEEALAIIRTAGGTPVLAHPIQTRGIGAPGSEEFYKNIEIIIARLKKQGLKGLECYHPDQNAEQSARFVELAEKYHLHITRGSDFHGDDFAKADPTADYR